MLGKSSDEKADGTTNKKIKWKKYYKKAEKKGIKKTSKNQMGMLDNVYNKKYKKLVDFPLCRFEAGKPNPFLQRSFLCK